MSEPRAVIFDLDGTLIDSAPDLAVAANRLLAEVGQPPLTLDAVQAMVGEGVARLVERLLAAVGVTLGESDIVRYTARFRALYLEDPCSRTTLYPGAAACLSRLAERHVLALCTNKPIAHTRLILEHFRLSGVFASIVGGDTLAVRKPDPAPLLHAIAESEARADASVFVGDSMTDLRTGLAAAVPVVLVDGGYTATPVREMPAQAHAASLGEVPDRVGELLGPG